MTTQFRFLKIQFYTLNYFNCVLGKYTALGYKNIFTCANGNYDIFENIEYGYLEDNFWYDITIGSSYEEYEIEKE